MRLSAESSSPWRWVARSVLDLLLPRQCEACGGPVEEDSAWEWLCVACSRGVVTVHPPCCRTCGYPYAGMLGAERSCPHCQELTPLFEEGRTLLLHRDAGASLVRTFKYHQGLHLLSDFQRLARDATGLAAYLQNAVLVPVPLHPTKLRERGYNQSQLLAECFVQATGAGTVKALLRRTRYTASQTRLARTERISNMKNAFALRDGTVLDAATTYIMVDDVFTTGATLNSCASALLEGGARKLKVLTLAHG